MSPSEWVALLASLVTVIGSSFTASRWFHSRQQVRKVGLMNELEKLREPLGKCARGQVLVQNSLSLYDLTDRITMFNNLSRQLPRGYSAWVTQTLVPGLEQIAMNATSRNIHEDEDRWLTAVSTQRKAGKLLQDVVDHKIGQLRQNANRSLLRRK